MITYCPFCNLNTAGQHQVNCPNYIIHESIHTFTLTQSQSDMEAKQSAHCTWKPDRQWEETGEWITECGESFMLIEGTPTENEMRFCPYCGRVLKEKS